MNRLAEILKKHQDSFTLTEDGTIIVKEHKVREAILKFLRKQKENNA